MATDFLALSQEAFENSSAYMDANWRPDWDYGIKAFRNEHASGSKYNSPEYASRSRLFRPKTRSVIRKNEAAAAVALFSNMEIVDLQPGDPGNVMSVAARDAMKALLEYRLSKTIPTFEICIGGIQDAQTQGVVCSYQYWEYEVRNGKKKKDKPCIELRPIENIRLDGGASWTDPVNSSPYFCDIIPMYVCDVKRMMNSGDGKTGAQKWKRFEDSVILKARPDIMDTTRKARLGKQQDPHLENQAIKHFDVVWVMRWFMRDEDGEDFTYYTLGTEELLTDPLPIEEVYFHGKRPYEMGYAILETHKTIKTSVPTLVRPLQQETNAVANDRLDNVKLVLHKRYYVARGRQVDVQSLVRGVAGGVTLMTDPKTDVIEGQWNDVTSSAYVEQDRISADLDELAGNFSPNTPLANKGARDTLGGNKQATQTAGLMTDYLIRTVIETWWEKVLRQLILLEAEYETDEKILALCAKNAQLFPRYNISSITDEMLKDEVILTVNVGMGASNPNERFAKLLGGTEAVMKVVMTAPPNFNVQEFIKEAYSNMGYRDGSRFWSDQQDPRLGKAMQMIQQLQQALQSKQMEMQATASIEQQKLLSNERIKGAEIKVNYERIQGDLQIRAAELEVQRMELALEEMRIRAELAGQSREHEAKFAEIGLKLEEAQLKLEGERQKLQGQAMKIAADVEKAHVDLQTAKMSQANEAQTADTVSKVKDSMASISQELANAQKEIAGISNIRDQVTQQGTAIGLMLSNMARKENRKPSKIKLKKSGGKTASVAIEFADGDVEEMAVE